MRVLVLRHGRVRRVRRRARGIEPGTVEGGCAGTARGQSGTSPRGTRSPQRRASALFPSRAVTPNARHSALASAQKVHLRRRAGARHGVVRRRGGGGHPGRGRAGRTRGEGRVRTGDRWEVGGGRRRYLCYFRLFRSCRDFLWTSIKTALRGGAHTCGALVAHSERARARASPRPTGRSRRTSPSPRASRAPCDHSSREGEPPRPSNARSSPRHVLEAARPLARSGSRQRRTRWRPRSRAPPAQARAPSYREAAPRSPPPRPATTSRRAPSSRRRREAARAGATSDARRPAAEAKSNRTRPYASSPRRRRAPVAARSSVPGRGRVMFATSRVPRGALGPCTAACTCLPCPPSRRRGGCVDPRAGGATTRRRRRRADLIHLAAGDLYGASHAAGQARAPPPTPGSARDGVSPRWRTTPRAGSSPTSSRCSRVGGRRRRAEDRRRRNVSAPGVSPESRRTAPDASRRLPRR